jgi:DNA-binding response OmpR family regulator
MKELVARVKAALRRGLSATERRDGEAIEVDELRVDPAHVQAYVNGQSADLTPTEFRVLYALALQRGRVVSRDELLQRIWGRRQGHRDRTVDVCIKRLRDKIDRGDTEHSFIHTRFGVGYIFESVVREAPAEAAAT